ncbi:MAG: hypothetical protein M0Q51_16010 [Bacteroidales bacterium]|nr:hypothetical protein [Bacteroidales bacterium]
MKAMRWLRSCGVRNINVLIDGHYYAELMQQPSGEEMKIGAGYSLYPIFQRSIFHPKIWMLFGEKEGLLIVGSGNLTNCGNGNNDEIWGAFHFDIRESVNALIFSTAWTYILGLCSSLKGQMHEKTTSWIIDHSKWLNELPTPKPFQFIETSSKEKLAYLFNSSETNIWQELLNLIGKERIAEITTISPYYDINGKALQELAKSFPKAQIRVVIDENGLIPSSMQVGKAFTFFNWYEAGVSKKQYAKSDNSQSKLHAKIIHFKTADNKEYCLFGSANVTPEGLGLGKNPNAEVSILFQSKGRKLLNELGIKLRPSNRYKLSEFAPSKPVSIFQTVIRNNQYIIHIVAAELAYNELIIYSEGEFIGSCNVVIYDSKSKRIFSDQITEFKHELKLKIDKPIDNCQYIQIIDDSNKIISNKLLISDYFLIAKTHPNPKTEDIERLYSEIQSGELGKVLDLLQFAINDETENYGEPNIYNRSNLTEIKKDLKKEPDRLYDLSTYKQIDHSLLEKNLLINSLTYRVLDALKLLYGKNYSANKQDDIREDEQVDDLASINGNEEHEVRSFHNLSLQSLVSEKRKLIYYFNYLYGYQNAILFLNEPKKINEPTLTDLVRYLIALELLLEYGGKTVKYDEQDKHNYFTYLPFFKDYNNTNVKGCCLNIIGDFLMMIRTGFKKYDFDYTNNKIEELKYDALITTIVCILNNRWKEDEIKYFDTLMLNALHYLGWKDVDLFNGRYNDLKLKIKEKIFFLKHPVIGIEENVSRFFNKICPAFKISILKRQNKEFDSAAYRDQYIYSSILGYCYVLNVLQGNELTLVRPGFLWDNDKEEYIQHRPTKFYSPIKLQSFINIDI